jgi:hypothetical protein
MRVVEYRTPLLSKRTCDLLSNSRHLCILCQFAMLVLNSFIHHLILAKESIGKDLTIFESGTNKSTLFFLS